jgi:hypothetical protein
MEMRAFEDHRTVGVAMGAVIAVDPKQNGLACPGRGVSETDRKVLAERTQDTDEHVEASGTFGCELEVETRVFHVAGRGAKDARDRLSDREQFGDGGGGVRGGHVGFASGVVGFRPT